MIRPGHRIFRLHFFFSGLIGLSILAWFFNSVPPKEGSVIGIAIVLSSITFFCFLATLIKNVRRCVLWSSGVGILLTLRVVQLHDWLYIFLLLILLGSIELAFRNK